MSRTFRHLKAAITALSVIALLLSLGAGGAADQAAVHVGGVAGKPGDWTAERLKTDLAGDLKSVDFSSKDQKHTCNCVPLLALLKASGVPTEIKMDPKADPKVKNYLLRLAVVVQGRDGYTATFSLAEMLPDIGNKAVWIAVDMDGAALPERDAPVRLIVPDDVKPGRWVHGVATINVIDPSAPPTQADH